MQAKENCMNSTWLYDHLIEGLRKFNGANKHNADG